MNMDAVTVGDCLDMHRMLGKAAFIKAGHVVCFYKEYGTEIKRKTALEYLNEKCPATGQSGQGTDVHTSSY